MTFPGRSFVAALLLVSIAVAPIVPAFTLGALPAGHDMGIHVVNAVAYADSLEAGIVIAHDVPTFRGGYGGANFKFYAPYSYLPAALAIRAGASPAAALAGSIALASLIAGLGAMRFARHALRPTAAIICAVVYALAPYRLVEIFPRGAHAELWGAALAPWVFVALERCRAARPGGVAALAIATALQGLVHPLSVLVTAPLAAVWLGIAARLRLSMLLRIGVAVVIGCALGAFYWLPALLDRGAIAMATQFDDRSSFVDQALRGTELWHGAPLPDWKPGVDPVFATLVAGAACWALATATGERRRVLAALACAIVALIATTPLGARAIVAVPGLDALRYLQFPWRLLLGWSLFAAWLIGAATAASRARWLRIALISLALAWTTWSVLPFGYGSTLPPAAGPTTTVPSAARIRSLLGHVAWTGDVEDKYRLVAQTTPPDQPATSIRLRAGTGRPRLERAEPERYVVRCDDAGQRWTATIGRLALDGWVAETPRGRATVDAAPGTALLRVMAADTDSVTLRYVGTPAYRAGRAISLLALVALAIALLRASRRPRGTLADGAPTPRTGRSAAPACGTDTTG